MDFIDDFLNGHVGIELNKDNYDEIDEVVELIKPFVAGMMIACGETLSYYFHGDVFGPIHFVDIHGECVNGACRKYFDGHNIVINILPASEFIKEFHEWIKTQGDDSEFDRIIDG